jgi:hypothetical protein
MAASDALKRNIIMALCYSRSNDELHCQALFGDYTTQGVRPMELSHCDLDFDQRYHAFMYGTRLDGRADDSGLVIHATYAGGILRPDVVGIGAHFLDATHDTEEAVNAAYQHYRPSAEAQAAAGAVGGGTAVTAQDRLYIAANNGSIKVPVLMKEVNGVQQVVIDMRPGMVLPGVYYYESRDHIRRYATTNDLYDKLDLDHICDKTYTGAADHAILAGAEGVRYRKLVNVLHQANEPDFNLRLRNVNHHNPGGNIANQGLRDVTTVGGVLFAGADHSKNNVVSSVGNGGGDGSAGSFDQLRYRYGTANGKSIIGIPLPVTVKPLHFPKSMAHGSNPTGDAAGHRSDFTRTMGSLLPDGNVDAAALRTDVATDYNTAPQFQRHNDNLLGYGDFVPLAYATVDATGVLVAGTPDARGTAATAHVALLYDAVYRIGPSQQPLRNPRPVADDSEKIASRLARRGRRNELGVAMQMIERGRQGDIMLHDGI